MPKTSKARIVEIFSPEEYKKMPKKMQWEELRRYWRRVYGYLLSPNPEPCVDIEFYRGMFESGQKWTVRVRRPIFRLGAHVLFWNPL